MSLVANIPEQEISQEPSIAERRSLIERIAASAHFSRSARLRDFLLYVGKQSLKPGCPEIHEQEIGAKVFGRSASYDRSQDNIVRVNATELRKRIEQYFASEGAQERLILEIPRGAYKPVFHWRQADLAVEPQPAPDLLGSLEPMGQIAAPQSRPHRGRTAYAGWLGVGLLVILASVCGELWVQNRSMHKLLYTWEGKPAVASLWQDFVRPSAETDIVLPDASLSIGEELVGHPISLPDYINRRYVSENEALPISEDRRRDLKDIYGHNLVAFGDFRAAQQILALSPVGAPFHMTLSRFFQAESVKHDNLILIGGKKANPWVDLLDEQMNFSLDYDDVGGDGFITNRHPHPGEAAAYANSSYPNGFVGYSVVAYLPNPSRTGNAIVVAGTDSDATNAAAEFLASEEQLDKFRSTLGVQKFPYFEVLLKTSRLSGTSFSSELLAYRTYPNLK